MKLDPKLEIIWGHNLSGVSSQSLKQIADNHSSHLVNVGGVVTISEVTINKTVAERVYEITADEAANLFGAQKWVIYYFQSSILKMMCLTC